MSAVSHENASVEMLETQMDVSANAMIKALGRRAKRPRYIYKHSS